MRNLFFLMLTAFSLVACEKDADMGKLDRDYLVYTNYDSKADFHSFRTYYLPDSVLIIGNHPKAEFWKDEQAQDILAAYADEMNQRGFVRVDNREEADLGLQVSYVKNSYYLTAYSQPTWWWDYPGYWDAPYWGNWGGCYYPYAVNYSYSTGSFITELLNLNVPEGKKEKLPVVWSCFMTGVLSDSSAFNAKLAIRGINQAFQQSAYLTHTNH